MAATASSLATAPKIVVRGTDRTCRELPMRAAIDAEYAPGPAVLVAADGAEIAARIVKEDGATVVYWVLDELGAGQSVAYSLESGKGGDGGVHVKRVGDNVDVTIDGKPFTTYVAMSGHKPICYPIYGPKGKPMTRSYPMEDARADEKTDHIHHRSFWFTHGDVNGVDFWAEGEKAGKIVQQTIEAAGGPVVGTIRTSNDWIAPDGTRVCTDKREMKFYNVTEGKLFDITIAVSALDKPVLFGDTKEGTFAFRTAASMKPDAGKGGMVCNAHGDTNDAAWGKAAPWVDTSGPVDGEVVGIAMLEHPASFRAPTTWHARTYGLVASNPFGWTSFMKGEGRNGDHTIEPGGSMTFRFRIWLHEGDAQEAGVDDVWRQYANPPSVEVVG